MRLPGVWLLTLALAVMLAVLPANPAVGQSADGGNRNGNGSAATPSPASSPANAGLATTTETGVLVTPFGRLRLDIAFDTRRLRREDNVNLVAPRFDDDESEFWLGANASLLGLSLEVPWMLDHGVASIVAVDFNDVAPDGSTPEAYEPRMRLRRAEVVLPVTRWFRVDAGYGADVVAPYRPDVLDEWRGLGAGDVGWEHARLVLRFARDARVVPAPTIRMPGLFDHTANDVGDWLGFSLAVVDPRANALGTRDADGIDGDDGRDAGKPVLHARLSFGPAPTSADPLGRQPEVGLSGAFGWQIITESVGPGVFDRTTRTAWLAALDARVPLPFDLTLTVEMWFGRNTDFVGGGMLLSGIDVDTLREVDAHGGWIQLVWRPTGITHPRLQLALAFGIDDPSSVDLYRNQGPGQVGGADRVQFLAGTVLIMPAPNLVIGVEVAWWKAEFFATNNNESLRSQLSIQLDF